jgi:hypothetical protein
MKKTLALACVLASLTAMTVSPAKAATHTSISGTIASDADGTMIDYALQARNRVTY